MHPFAWMTYTMAKDFYEILGVGKTASADEIKKRTASWRISTILTREMKTPISLKR